MFGKTVFILNNFCKSIIIPYNILYIGSYLTDQWAVGTAIFWPSLWGFPEEHWSGDKCDCHNNEHVFLCHELCGFVLRFSLPQIWLAMHRLDGGILYFLGSAMQMFANSTLHLIFSFSLVQGIGFGLCLPTCYTTFNNYFVKNRVMWMGFAQTLIGLGSMIYPIAMQKLMDWYGFRGCLLILTGINAHAVLGMLLMQPVEWHMKRVPLDEEEVQLQLTTPRPTVVVHVQPETPLKIIAEPKFIPMPGSDYTTDSLSVSRFSSRRVSHAEEQTLKNLTSRSSSITSLGNWTGPVVVTDASPQMMHSLQASRRQSITSVSPVPFPDGTPNDVTADKKSLCATIVDFLDLTLLKQPVYVNIVLGITFALYSDIAFFTMQPIYLFELGYTKVSSNPTIKIDYII